MLLLNEYASKHNVGAVCSEEETDLIIQGQDTAPSSTYLYDFIDGETDLLANSSVSLEVNFKIVKRKLKIEEKILM